MSRTGRLALALLGAALFGAACRDTQAPKVRVPVGLRLPDSVVVLEGDSLRLRAALVDSTGDTIPSEQIAWVSEDTLIARVSAGGILRPGDPGEATVMALAAGLSATVRVVSAVRYAQISLGSFGSYFVTWCGLTERGSLVCKDLADRRQNHLTPLQLPAGVVLRSISVGGSHVCAVATDGRAFCWGNNRYGQLGADTATGSYDNVWTPMAVAGNLTFDSVSAGAAHTCGVTAGGSAYCWGSRGSGRLGDGDSTIPFGYSTVPVAVAGGHAFRSLCAGTGHTCGLATDGNLYCWGTNDVAELGIGTLSPSIVVRPLLVAGGLRFVSVSAGYHTCALAVDGVVYCWGNNAYGALGHPTDTTCTWGYPCSLAPQPVSLGAAVQVGTGLRLANTSRTCALTSSGAAYCWGRGPLGDGLGADTIEAVPVAVAGGHVFRSITVGEADACGTTPAGVVWCWGSSVGLVPTRLAFQP